MVFTIQDVLQLFQEQDIKLVAGGKGINNCIASVNIMDAPDIWNWVSPKQLILTTAYAIRKDSTLQEELIRNLAAAKCAGLGIKTKRYLPEIPESMQQLADQLGFPLLELPLNLSLAEIMNPIVSSIAARQSLILQQSTEIHKTLTDVAVSGGDLHDIIAKLGMLIHCPVGCYDPKGVLISSWMPDTMPGHDPSILPLLEQHLKQRTLEHNRLYEKLSQLKQPYTQSIEIHNTEFLDTSSVIMSSNEFFGHLAILQPLQALHKINCVALEHACTVATLDFLKRKAVSESRRLHARDLVEHIVFGNLDQALMIDIGATSKLTQIKNLKCSIIEVDSAEKEINLPLVLNRLYRLTQHKVSEKYPASLISERAGKIVLLLATNQSFNDDSDLYHELHQAFRHRYKNLSISIGVGTVVTDIPSVRLSYHQAIQCLQLGRDLKGNGSITFPHEIASYAILIRPDVSHTLTDVCGPILAKLDKVDKNTNGDLVKTLEKYLECDKNLTETAKELYIHRNTLTHRLDRITDLCGLDFTDRELLFCLRLTLRQRKIQQHALDHSHQT